MMTTALKWALAEAIVSTATAVWTWVEYGREKKNSDNNTITTTDYTVLDDGTDKREDTNTGELYGGEATHHH